jgi:hypothetical protein
MAHWIAAKKADSEKEHKAGMFGNFSPTRNSMSTRGYGIDSNDGDCQASHARTPIA